MDTKSKKTRFLNFLEKNYKYILIGIVCCICLSTWSYVNYKKYEDVNYGHSVDYLNMKDELSIWENMYLYNVNFDIYNKTNYLSIFKLNQNEINTYSKNIDSYMIEYLIKKQINILQIQMTSKRILKHI